MHTSTAHVVPIDGGAASFIEAVLFAASRPVPLERLAKVAGVSHAQITQTLHLLQRQGERRGITVAWNVSHAELTVHPRYLDVVAAAGQGDQERSLELIEEYLSAQRQRGRRPGTIRAYRYFLRRFASQVGVPVEEADTRDIRRFLMREEQRGNGLATMASKVHKLSALYQWLLREEIIERNPMLRIDAPRVPEPEDRYLTHEEIEQLRDAATPTQLLLLEVLYSTGLRVSELVALDWSDVDLEDRTARVRDGKGGKARDVLLSTKAARLLRSYRDRRRDDGPYVFRSRNRNRMAKDTVAYHMRNLGKAAGLSKRLTPHRLRHSMAKHLREAGMPLDVLQALLGHSKLQTTQRYSGLPDHEVRHYYRMAFQ